MELNLKPIKMEEQIISLETAKLAKEKGFNEATLRYHSTSAQETFAAPTQSLLQKWLRESHEVHIYIEPYKKFGETKTYYEWVVVASLNQDEDLTPNEFNTYEEALEAGLIEALTLI